MTNKKFSFEFVTEDLVREKHMNLQSVIKYLRLTLVSM